MKLSLPGLTEIRSTPFVASLTNQLARRGVISAETAGIQPLFFDTFQKADITPLPAFDAPMPQRRSFLAFSEASAKIDAPVVTIPSLHTLDVTGLSRLTAPQWRQIVKTFTTADVQEIFSHHGEAPLLHAYFNCFLMGNIPASELRFANTLELALRKLAGRDPEILKKTAVWADDAPRTHYTLYYQLLEFLLRGGLNGLPLNKTLQSTSKNPLSEKRLKDYALIPLESFNGSTSGYAREWKAPQFIQRHHDERYINIFLDGTYGFALTYKGIPNAVVSFDITPNGALKIVQIQGVRPENSELKHTGGARGLIPLDWQRVMVSLAAETARRTGFTNLIIQSAKNSDWEPVRMRGSKNYDQTAIRLGFTRDWLGNGDWSRPVKD